MLVESAYVKFAALSTVAEPRGRASGPLRVGQTGAHQFHQSQDGPPRPGSGSAAVMRVPVQIYVDEHSVKLCANTV